MTKEQQEQLKAFDNEIADIERRFANFVEQVSEGRDNHPLWQVWQPLSTAQGRIGLYTATTV